MPTPDTLTNECLTIAVRQPGAELCSLHTAAGEELLWQADPAIWGRHAPVLFPIVGKLAGDRYTLDGQAYTMRQHGFARDSDFARVARTADTLTYQLLPSAATRAQYPFDFELRIRFRLAGPTLDVGWSVRNAGTTAMPFSIGAHPGFALNWTRPHRIDDYALEFSALESGGAQLLDAQHRIAPGQIPVLEGGTRLPLRANLFDRDALIFLNLRSESVTLCARNHPRRIRVAFPGFPALGIWAKPGAPFVCIEPWHGHADTPDATGDLRQKPGIRTLAPGTQFDCAYTIAVSDQL